MTRAMEYRHSPLEVHGDPEGDERVCPLCGALGRKHTIAREVAVDPKYVSWLGARAASKSYLMCPRDALPEHGGPRSHIKGSPTERDGGAVFGCPNCGTELRTENALMRGVIPNGLRFQGLACAGCGSSFTVELTETPE